MTLQADYRPSRAAHKALWGLLSLHRRKQPQQRGEEPLSPDKHGCEAWYTCDENDALHFTHEWPGMSKGGVSCRWRAVLAFCKLGEACPLAIASWWANRVLTRPWDTRHRSRMKRKTTLDQRWRCSHLWHHCIFYNPDSESRTLDVWWGFFHYGFHLMITSSISQSNECCCHYTFNNISLVQPMTQTLIIWNYSERSNEKKMLPINQN